MKIFFFKLIFLFSRSAGMLPRSATFTRSITTFAHPPILTNPTPDLASGTLTVVPLTHLSAGSLFPKGLFTHMPRPYGIIFLNSLLNASPLLPLNQLLVSISCRLRAYVIAGIVLFHSPPSCCLVL
jgi:hypothetical protein